MSVDKHDAPAGYVARRTSNGLCEDAEGACAFFGQWCEKPCPTEFGCTATRRNDGQDVIFVKAQPRDTSVAAQPKGGRIVDQVLEELQQRGPGTRLELAERMQKKINCITAPVLQLLNEGRIQETKLVQNAETGKSAWLLEVRDAIQS